MRAIFFRKTGGIDQIEAGDLDLPRSPKNQGEVAISFRAGSLNHIDLWIIKGLPHLKYEFPHIAGADICGEVVESKSSKFKKGDRVLVYPAESSGKNAQGLPTPENLCEDFKIRGENTAGVFRECLIISDRYVFPAPKHLSDEEAAAIPLAYLTAWQMVTEKAALAPGQNSNEKILVHAAGSGVSQAILEILISFGEKNIGLTSRDPKKLEIWKKRGIETFILDSQASDKIKSWAGKQKIGIIFDHIGQSVFEMNIRLLKNGGKFITCGATSGFAADLDLRHLFFRQLQLLGSTMGSLKAFEKMLAWVERSKIKPIIAKSFDWNSAREAYQYMEKSVQAGKIVIK